jgi:hypothetical protein
VTKVIGRLGSSAIIFVFLSGLAAAQPTPSPGGPTLTAESLYLRLGDVGLDKSRIYRIRDASVDRGAVHISMDDGTIGFTEDVAGRVTGAFFEGDGEILISPPNQVERSSMSLFTGSAILEERFVTAYLRFNDSTFEQLREFLTPASSPGDFYSSWNDVARRLSQSDDLRLFLTFSKYLSGGSSSEGTDPKPGVGQVPNDQMLHARLQGRKLGTFDAYYDSIASEQNVVGQSKILDGVAYFNVWASFASQQRTVQHGSAGPNAEEGKSGSINISQYTIKAEITPPTKLSADAVLDAEVLEGGERTLLFELSRFLQVTQVEADGHPVDFIHNPALAGTHHSRRGKDLMAIVFPKPLQAGRKLRLHFVYGGDVLSEAGRGLLYVGARGTWYPNRGLAMSNFDLQFRYPAGWTLVATGKHVDKPGPAAEYPGQQFSRWISERPIPVAGFNLGKYAHFGVRAGDVSVEAYATSGVERAFPKPAPELVPIVPLPTRPGLPQAGLGVAIPPPPSPSRNLQSVADRSAEAIEFYARDFGPYPYSKLVLTQIPGPLSQGWPGLIFLSSFSFLTGAEKAQLHLSPVDLTLTDAVVAHETAHQWWGDLITWSGYRDQWLFEALANYSSLMLLESKDPERFHEVLSKYRDDLLAKNKEGVPLRDAGPVTLGSRLVSSRFPDGYEAISYGRGTWLFHMLRTMLKDGERRDAAQEKNSPEPFVRVLHKLRDQYQGKAITTEQLLQEFAQELPPSLRYEDGKSLDWFYEGWVKGTSIPVLQLEGVKVKVNQQKNAAIVSGTILQKEAPKELVTAVPVYAVVGERNIFMGRVFADGPETSFRLNAPVGTRKVVLDPEQTLLARVR